MDVSIESVEESTPVNARRSKKDQKFYAIRGIGSGIICETWGEAVNNGFIQKAGYGNAVKFTTREDAEEFIKIKAFPMTMNNQVKGWIEKQHPLIRLCVFSIMVSFFFVMIFYLTIKLEDYLMCRENVQLASTNMCVSLKRLNIVISEQFNKLVDIVFYEIIGAILVFSSWMVGLI